MGSVSYGAFLDENNSGLYHCSRSSDKEPLLVNCAGNFVASSTFTTYSAKGRPDYYLMYILAGTLKVEAPDGIINCGTGNFLLFPPEVRYKYTHDTDDELNYMWVHFTGYGVEDAVEKYGISLFPIVNEIKESSGIIARFHNIFDSFAKQDQYRDRELALLLERLFISLARRKDGDNYKSNSLKASLSHIHRFYNTDIKIPELAKIENLSLSRYNTLFKQIMSISPIQYITKLRISSAAELLSATDLPISKISSLVGYRDQHFFSRIFRSVTGKSPSEYRDIC